MAQNRESHGELHSNRSALIAPNVTLSILRTVVACSTIEVLPALGGLVIRIAIVPTGGSCLTSTRSSLLTSPCAAP